MFIWTVFSAPNNHHVMPWHESRSAHVSRLVRYTSLVQTRKWVEAEWTSTPLVLRSPTDLRVSSLRLFAFRYVYTVSFNNIYSFVPINRKITKCNLFWIANNTKYVWLERIAPCFRSKWYCKKCYLWPTRTLLTLIRWKVVIHHQMMFVVCSLLLFVQC